MTDNISGETVTYQYDSLKRLLSAAGSGWAETYGYDAFGSLVSKTPTAGSPPTLSIAVNPVNNQVVGYPYDANGNQLAAPALGTSPTLTYDAENRLVAAPGVQYGYDSKNKRVWNATLNGQGQLTGQRAYFYGVDGTMLGVYTLTLGGSLTASPSYLAVYFKSKRVAVAPNGTTFSAFNQDRLGSQGTYYPYGEDQGTPLPNDQFKFATYWRDSATGLDYANQRYFVNNFGRFMTPDPYGGSMSAANPQSWNRFAYVLGDPVNGRDPRGLKCIVTDGGTYADDGTGGGCPQAGVSANGDIGADIVNVVGSIGPGGPEGKTDDSCTFGQCLGQLIGTDNPLPSQWCPAGQSRNSFGSCVEDLVCGVGEVYDSSQGSCVDAALANRSSDLALVPPPAPSTPAQAVNNGRLTPVGTGQALSFWDKVGLDVSCLFALDPDYATPLGIGPGPSDSRDSTSTTDGQGPPYGPNGSGRSVPYGGSPAIPRGTANGAAVGVGIVQCITNVYTAWPRH
ncbi:MAG: RHS repeat-associated core domain-containing protein [Acidobacteriia bacterium]|nr:RHS repeat-associated core domain-containing protein [Terriglobia bacterium]